MTDNEAVAILDYLQFVLIKHVGERIERITDNDNIVGHLYDGIYAALNDVDTTLDALILLQEQEAAAKRTR